MFDNSFEMVGLDCPPEPEDTGQLLASKCAPSGWLALELDQGCAGLGSQDDPSPF